MDKNVILDTNVLIDDPNSIYKFGSSNVFLPISSIGELDRIKKESSERGRNSRKISRVLDSLLNISEVDENGVRAKIAPDRGNIYFIGVPGPTESDVDSDILKVAIIVSRWANSETVLITNDVNLRIRAKINNIKSESYSDSRHSFNKESSTVEIKIDGNDIDDFFRTGYMEWTDHSQMISPNSSVILTSSSSHSALARYHSKDNNLRPLRIPKEGVNGIRPKNKEQSFALDVLLDEDIQLVCLFGKAGTGKTLLAMAAGLHSLEKGVYTRLLVTRPIIPVGRDMGHLPGTLEEKMNPWMQPIYDNLEIINNSNGSVKEGSMDNTRKFLFKSMFDSGKIQIEPITYMRGRSLPLQFIIADEAQNLSAHEIKTLLTRVGEGSKIILTGDPDQIDNPSVDGFTNGMSIVAEKFRNKREAASITLTRGTRSSLAELAADILLRVRQVRNAYRRGALKNGRPNKILNHSLYLPIQLHSLLIPWVRV